MTDEADIEPAPRFDRRIPVGQVGDADGIGGMLVAGPWSVMSYDGKQWRFIVAPYHE